MALRFIIRSKNEFGIVEEAELKLQYMCAPNILIDSVERPSEDELRSYLRPRNIPEELNENEYIFVEPEGASYSGRKTDYLISKVGILAAEGDGNFRYSNHYIVDGS